MEVLRISRNWTLWMWKWNTVTLNHIITVDSDKEKRLVFHGEVSLPEAVQVFYYSDSQDGHAAHICVCPGSFPEVVLIHEMGQWSVY